MSARRTRAAFVAVLATLAIPSAAQASDTQFAAMMDDDLLVYRSDDTRDAALKRMKALGVDHVRVTLLWSVVAEDARKTKALDRRFRRLGADHPKAYPKLNWDRYDRLVRAGRTLGIGIWFNVTGPGPKWGHAKAPRSQRRLAKAWKPKAREFKLFVKAVGRRYSGRFRDENDGRRVLPTVRMWSLYNEPNQGNWLAPQYERGRPSAPWMYRRLYVAGREGLVATGHSRDWIFAGETAPLGRPGTAARIPVAPVPFLRAFFCIDANGAPLTGEEARVHRCSDFDKHGPISTTALAHHPYTKKTPPYQADPNPDHITVANLGTLETLLDQAAAAGRVGPGLPIVSSEFGYETNPPDPHQGISPDLAATWENIGELIMFRNPRVMGNTHFLLKDVKPNRRHRAGSKAYWFTYQSGLFGLDSQPKATWSAYAFPFVAFTTGALSGNNRPIYEVWGQLKWRPNGLPAGTDSVQLQFLPADGSTGWTPIGDPISVLNPLGYFEAKVESPGPGQIRAHWEGQGVPSVADSRPYPVG